ncbi:MAG: hypothetical protein M3015_13635, partial [Bacteroidota bacterium]|nr:hypothetical protein [Bacteroidota bacterium]
MKSFISIAPLYRRMLIATGIIFISMAFRDPFPSPAITNSKAKIIKLLDTVPQTGNIKIEININKIMADVDLALSKIDFGQIAKSVEVSLEKINFDKMQKDIDA